MNRGNRSRPGLRLFGLDGSHSRHNLHGLYADGADPTQQIDYLFFVIAEVIGVELLADGGVARRALFVAIKHPL